MATIRLSVNGKARCTTTCALYVAKLVSAPKSELPGGLGSSSGETFDRTSATDLAIDFSMIPFAGA